jgi:hypothetical protein
MIKYNLSIGCTKYIDSSHLDYLIELYDARIIGCDSDDLYDYFNYIITEDNIVGFISELPFDYFIRYLLDDTLLQIFYQKKTKKTKSYIYINYNIENTKPDFKKHLNEIEIELYDLCKYIEENHFLL